MKKKLAICLMLIMVGAFVFGLTVQAAPVKNMTDEEITAMVDEKVNSAVSGAKAEMQTQIDAQGQAISNASTTEKESSNGVGMIAAALATGFACIGSGIAVAVVASSAVGAISEDPSLLGKTIIFAGLAEGIAIYGLIISIMILNKI